MFTMTLPPGLQIAPKIHLEGSKNFTPGIFWKKKVQEFRNSPYWSILGKIVKNKPKQIAKILIFVYFLPFSAPVGLKNRL